MFKTYLQCGISVGTTLALVALNTDSTQAAIIITATENGSEVTFAYEGTLNIDGLDFDDDINYLVGINPSRGGLNFGPVPGSQANPNAGDRYYPAFASGPTNFGTGDGVFGPATIVSTSGDPFQLFGSFDEITVPNGFTSGFIAGEFTLLGTFSSLGIDSSQSYIWTLDNATADTITLQFVPEPLTFLGASAAGVLGASFKRRKVGNRHR